MTHRVRADWQLLLIALLAMPLAAVAAIGIDHVALRSLLTPAIPIALFIVARQSWGSIAVAAIPFLLPDLPTHYGVEGLLQLTVLTGLIVVVYWDRLGRPPVSTLALWASGMFAAFIFMLTWANGLDVQQAGWISLAPFIGVTFGSCLATSKTARQALGFGCVPLALLALAEIAGFNNPWPHLVHATNFLQVSQQVDANRAQSTFGHPLIAGGCLAGMSALMLQSRTRFSTAVAAVLAAGALATVSRSAILGLGAALACSIVLSNRRGRNLLQAAVIVVFALLIATQIPALSESITTRITSANSITYTDQPVRAYAITKLRGDLSDNPGALLLGGGVGAAGNELTAIGGVDGYDIFDNQYVTSIYDLGLLPMIVIAVLLVRAIATASPEARRLGLPALTAVAGVMFFADGAYWLSLDFLAWTTVGLSSAPWADV